MSTQQEYLEPVPYFIRNQDELSQLQGEAVALRETVESKKASWVDRTRAEERLKDVEREIRASRYGDGVTRGPFDRVTTQQQAVVRSDCGNAYLVLPAANASPAPSRREPEQAYMPIAPPSDPAGRAPESFAARAAVVQAACDEIRRKAMA